MTTAEPFNRQTVVPRHPALPDHFNDLIKTITDIAFMKPSTEPVDIVFAFGSWNQYKALSKALTRIYETGLSRDFILTGGFPNNPEPGTPLISVTDRVLGVLPQTMQDSCTIHCQNKSTNSLEDAVFAQPYLEPYQTQTIGCVARNWAFRRQYLTLQKCVPHARILPLPYDEELTDGSVITSENWHLNTEFRSMVWGEILRIKFYGERGDIAYPPDICAKIEEMLIPKA